MFKAYLLATEKCNYFDSVCKGYCYYSLDPSKISRAQFSFSGMKKVLKNLVSLGIREVVFSGGEPLVRTHIAEEIEEANDRGFNVILITNGSLIPDPKEKPLYVDFGVLSLNALTFHNVDVSQYKRRVDALRAHRIDDICLDMVVTPHNAHYIDEVSRFAEQEGLRAHFQPWYSGRQQDFSQVLPLLEGRVSQKYLEVMSDYLCNGKKPGFCNSPRYGFVIKPDGTINSCLNDPTPMGDILKDSTYKLRKALVQRTRILRKGECFKEQCIPMFAYE